MNRIQLNVRARGVSYMVLYPLRNQITDIVRCCIAITRGRSNPVKKILVGGSKVKILHFLIFFKGVFLWLWNDTSAKLELDKN